MMSSRGIKAYQKDGLKSTVAAADPHKVIQLLMQGVLDKSAVAKGQIDRKDFEGKSESLSKITAIIFALRDSLDMSSGTELVNNLSALYEYMAELTMQAGSEMSTSKLDEVCQLMNTVKTAWDQISENDKQAGYAMQRQKG